MSNKAPGKELEEKLNEDKKVSTGNGNNSPSSSPFWGRAGKAVTNVVTSVFPPVGLNSPSNERFRPQK